MTIFFLFINYISVSTISVDLNRLQFCLNLAFVESEKCFTCDFQMRASCEKNYEYQCDNSHRVLKAISTRINKKKRK
jgi:hypothetical protein